jgi:uncharacterized protein
MMTQKLKWIVATVGVAALSAGIAIAQSTTTPLPAPTPAPVVTLLSQALADATIGEQHDGYMGFKVPPSAALRREVDALNIKRRAAFTDVAQTKNVTPKEVAAAVGCQTLSKVPVGRAYLLEDNVWRVRKAGEVIKLPAYCNA